LKWDEYISKSDPNIKCNVYFDDEEWQSAYVFVNKIKPPRKAPDLQSIIVCIAKMGGYLNRKNDSPPGPKAIWQGLTKLYSFLQINDIYEQILTYG
jgi:hypothetical protein